MDAVILARIQFAATALYHFLFVPLSIGFGLILVVLLTKAYRTEDAHDRALARFWTRIFALTFAVGVATGITMEFSFGTNWADYSRFVGNIFGAPLAAEALFAFFLESVFLGVLLFGEKKVGKKFYLASGWLVWLGSCLSALWIIIANSWMQTPAGYELAVTESGSTIAVLTNFWQAAFNYSTMERYCHVLVALLITGAVFSIAVGAYYLLKDRNRNYAMTLIKIGAVAGAVSVALMVPVAHQQAVEVSEQQPAKLAALEGQWESGPVEMSFFGWVDEENQVTHTLAIPGLTSWLASGSFDTVYPGINDFPEEYQTGNVNAIYQFYHFMLYFLAIVVLAVVFAFVVWRGKLANNKLVLGIMMAGPLAALLAIECGWMVAELGRQPWIVYGELMTADATSLAVTPAMLLITLALFAVVYILIYALWIRSMARTIKAGPEAFLENAAAATDAEPAAAGFATGNEGMWE